MQAGIDQLPNSPSHHKQILVVVNVDVVLPRVNDLGWSVLELWEPGGFAFDFQVLMVEPVPIPVSDGVNGGDVGYFLPFRGMKGGLPQLQIFFSPSFFWGRGEKHSERSTSASTPGDSPHKG